MGGVGVQAGFGGGGLSPPFFRGLGCAAATLPQPCGPWEGSSWGRGTPAEVLGAPGGKASLGVSSTGSLPRATGPAAASLLWVLLVWGQRCRRQVSGLCCVTVGKVTAPGHLGNPLGLCALCACCEYVCSVSPWYPSVCVCVSMCSVCVCYVYILRTCCLCVCSVCCLCVVCVCVCVSVWCVCVSVCVVCVWCVCLCMVYVGFVCFQLQGAETQVPCRGHVPSPHVPRAWASLGRASAGLQPHLVASGPVQLETHQGRASVGVSLAGTAASPGLGLAGGCWLPCQRPGLWPLLALPPPLWSLTLGPQGLWAWRSNCP